jgi:hypothetical protein
MPKLFVVGDQKNLAELAPALLRSRTSAAVRESALDAVRRANPSLDFDRIAPGTVVVVPRFDGAKDASSEDPVRRAADDLITRVEEGVGTLAAAAEAAEEQRGVEKKAAQELFGSAAVKRLASQLPGLAANVDSVRATFKEDDAAAKKQVGGLGEAQQLWAEDLETLRGLL